MRLLLDTQVALWALTDDLRLSPQAHGRILDAHNEVFVSLATLWEIAIKYQLGRGEMPVSARRAAELFRAAGFAELSILREHALAVETLPAIHGDPFDRILIAQALTEPLRLLTHDRTVARYSEEIVFV